MIERQEDDLVLNGQSEQVEVMPLSEQLKGKLADVLCHVYDLPYIIPIRKEILRKYAFYIMAANMNYKETDLEHPEIIESFNNFPLNEKIRQQVLSVLRFAFFPEEYKSSDSPIVEKTRYKIIDLLGFLLKINNGERKDLFTAKKAKEPRSITQKVSAEKVAY